MSRWNRFLVCAILGLVMLVRSLLVPAHLQVVGTSVLQQTGRSPSALAGQGRSVANAISLGAAQLRL